MKQFKSILPKASLNLNKQDNYTILQQGDCLENGTFIRHSVFKNVINFNTANNDFCFITNDLTYNAPNAITLFPKPLKQFQTIKISKQSIIIDQNEFKRNNIPIYKSEIMQEHINAQILNKNIDKILHNNQADFPEKSLAFLLCAENLKHFEKGFDKAFAQNALTSYNYIISGDIVQGIKQIKGTGYGLTPSGDDFTAGFLFGLHLKQIINKKKLESLRNDIYIAALGKNHFTNSFLMLAKNAKYFYRLKNFVTLLSEKEFGDLETALKMLLSTGATSGADLLTGLIISLKYSEGL